MTQLSFLDGPLALGARAITRFRRSHDDEELVVAFEAARTAADAHPSSVKREVSQLRSLVREASIIDPAITLRSLVARIDLLAQALREPATPMSRPTGRARLIAVQRFIRTIGPSLGHDPDVVLAILAAHLPTRRSHGWHSTGTLVAGAVGRRRRLGPTLDAADLRRLLDTAGAEDDRHALRDRALVALHCFSGLRPEEIVGLRWENLSTELTATGHYGLTAAVERGGRSIDLILPGPAGAAVMALARSREAPVEALFGPVLLARGTSDRPLSYRAARDVLKTVCRRAGLPTIDAVALRAAYAHGLRTQGLSDHEVAAVLGLARVRSVDRLLQHHSALNAQRIVRERLVR